MTKTLPNRLWTLPAPRMCRTDAYTASAGCFDSARALDFADYYLTFRHFMGKNRTPNDIAVFKEGDSRMLFFGLRPIPERLLYDPVTHAEIDEAKRFYANRKVKSNGTFEDFEFMEPLWRRVVTDFGGYPPISISALPEGSTWYPGEPAVRVRNTVRGFGPLAAWFEASLMKIWNASQRGTINRHWLERLRERIKKTEGDISPQMLDIWARASCHDFSARATASDEENAHCAGYDLMTFHGTDTFHGAYYMWKDGAPNYAGNSVWAGAHHSVQGFEYEADFYETIYSNAPPNSLISMIGDCYDWNAAVDNHLLRLAVRSKNENNGKVVVGRPDSSESFEEKRDQMLEWAKKAIALGLFVEKRGGDGNMYTHGTFARMIQGDSMSHEQMAAIDDAFIANGLSPHGWYIYGLGGYRIRSINRDSASAKYALYSVGEHHAPVLKISMALGKRTRPSCKVIRTAEALASGKTVVTWEEPGEDAFVDYFNGESGEPFKDGFRENYPIIAARTNDQFNQMPPDGGHMSDKLIALSDSIMETNLENYRSSQPA